MKAHFIKRGIGIGLAIIGGIFLLGFVVMHLWNWLIPAIFEGAVSITYLQALGLLVLSKILFGNFKNHKRCDSYSSPCCTKCDSQEKLENLTEEEREKIRKWCRCD